MSRFNPNFTFTQALRAAIRQHGILASIVIFPLALLKILFAH